MCIFMGYIYTAYSLVKLAAIDARIGEFKHVTWCHCGAALVRFVELKWFGKKVAIFFRELGILITKSSD